MFALLLRHATHIRRIISCFLQCDMKTKGPQQPTDFESDIYPVHLLDNAKTFRNYESYLFRFNDVLDSKKLYSSLSRLLEIGNWRKVGGRLRLKVCIMDITYLA